MVQVHAGSKAFRRASRALLIACAGTLALSLGLWVASVKSPFVIGYERDVPYTGKDAATRPQTLDRYADFVAVIDGRVVWERSRYPSWTGDRSRPDMQGPSPRGLFACATSTGVFMPEWNDWADYRRTVRVRVLAGAGVCFDAAGRGTYLILLIPFYLPALPATLPLIACGLSHWRRRRRAERGLCPRCAYARHGLALGAACPECGVAPTAAITSPPPAAALDAAPRSRP